MASPYRLVTVDEPYAGPVTSLGKKLACVVSGGQTGVDRAALDTAIAQRIPYRGWCPRDGWAEDEPAAPGLLARYPELHETPSADPGQRTRWNTRDADATLILRPAGVYSPGTDLAGRCATLIGRPLAAADPNAHDADATIRHFVAGLPNRPSLHIAGPRESESPGVYAATRELLARVFADRIG
jgi:hypothetical protein